MMKKTLLFALAAIAMTSCSKDETMQTNTGNSIGFRASLGKSTRANVTTLSNLNTFYVTALGNGTNYFTRMEVTSQDNGATWQTAQTHYWPAYELEFFASNMRTNMNVTPEAQTIADYQPHVIPWARRATSRSTIWWWPTTRVTAPTTKVRALR